MNNKDKKITLSIRFNDELQMMEWVDELQDKMFSRELFVREMDALDDTGKRYVLDGGRDTSQRMYLKVTESHTKSVQTEGGPTALKVNHWNSIPTSWLNGPTHG